MRYRIDYRPRWSRCSADIRALRSGKRCCRTRSMQGDGLTDHGNRRTMR